MRLKGISDKGLKRLARSVRGQEYGKKRLYIYDPETREVIAVAEGATEQECEEKALPYANEYGATYSPAFGTAEGLVMTPDAEIL